MSDNPFRRMTQSEAERILEGVSEIERGAPVMQGTDMPNSPVGLDEQIACVARELRIREKVYPNWVSAGRMKLDAAEREIATMAAVLATLEGMRSSALGNG